VIRRLPAQPPFTEPAHVLQPAAGHEPHHQPGLPSPGLEAVREPPGASTASFAGLTGREGNGPAQTA
jgi:hypothetical protein